MKWHHVVAKNLKLLFRSKETAFTVIFGPLLIILLVSAAYTGGDTDSQLRVGTYAPEYTPLANQFIQSLKENNYLVSNFNNKTRCIDGIASGQVHTCIIFPADFRVKENGTNVVTFAVDYSRVNLVYEIIDGLGSELDIQRSAISEGIADTMLSRISMVETTLGEEITNAKAIDESLLHVRDSLTSGRGTLASVDVNVSYVDLLQIRGRVTGLGSTITNIKDQARKALEIAEESLRDARSDVGNETRDGIDETLDSLENATIELEALADDAPKAVTEVGYLLDDAAAAMEQTKERFGELVNASEEVDAGLADSLDHLNNALTKLTTLRGKLAHAHAALQESLNLTTTGLTAPITTRIEPVNSEESKLTFTYPYVLLLVIMFLGLMLNSSLIVMDKTSRAAFRNFTTATRDEYHVLVSFITTFLILLAQTLIILLVSYFFVKAPLFSNFGVSLLIICFAITLFSFLGMIIGYVTGTQEAAMIASLSLGSILLFVSNLVLPLEAMNRFVGVLSAYNPYVVLSEMLKQSMLFGLQLRHVPGKFALLSLAILVLFGFILIVQRSFKVAYFQRRSKDLAAGAFASKARKVKPLHLGERTVKDLFDLLEVLDGMTRSEFERLVTTKKNVIAKWVGGEVGERKLARKFCSRSKERMILALDNHLKRETKKLAKKR